MALGWQLEARTRNGPFAVDAEQLQIAGLADQLPRAPLDLGNRRRRRRRGCRGSSGHRVHQLG
eukprot:6678473-Pyramimonas_sp.AAC.1